MQIVDAHHHLWDLSAVHYPWLMARGVKRFFGDPTPIQKNYLVEDLRGDAARFELLGSVHIQVGAADGDEVLESRWLQETAERDGLPSAIVAYCDLAHPDVESCLQQQRQFSKLRGIRQIVGRSAEEDAHTGSGNLLDNERWHAGLALLADKGLSFDLQLIPQQLQRAAEVLSRTPDLKVALCHCGSPWDQSASGLRMWRHGLETLAALDNVHCKISGLGMFDHEWTCDSIRPVVETVIDVFGTERTMFGSNFPVDKLHADYSTVWAAYDEITSTLGAADRERLFVDNARAFYAI